MNEEYSKHLLSIFEDEVLYERMTKRLDFLKRIYKRSDNRLFAEFCFCLCTPQTKARNGFKTISELIKNDALFNGGFEEISSLLKKYVRFHNVKTENILLARELYFKNNKFSLRKDIDDASKNDSVIELRNKLAKEVKGYGLKEASHFLRNIGFGHKLAILDRHILREMEKLNILPSGFTPKTNLTQKNYLLCESHLINYSNLVAIPPEYLDFVMWYDATSDIFK